MPWLYWKAGKGSTRIGQNLLASVKRRVPESSCPEGEEGGEAVVAMAAPDYHDSILLRGTFPRVSLVPDKEVPWESPGRENECSRGDKRRGGGWNPRAYWAGERAGPCIGKILCRLYYCGMGDNP